ncbi:FG-GAP repeat protein, partial [candidate division KSB1 bacterium]|nr:FG-GAP repeat protein [candidate division KSB1 bacterium]
NNFDRDPDWIAGGRGLTGYCVAAAGDVNGDGYDDIMVTDYVALPGRERSYVYILAGRPGLTETNVTAKQAASVQPETTVLLPNYPNPFNSRTVIPYRLASDGRIKIIIYNLKGEEVKFLYDGFQHSGTHTCIWDGMDRKNIQQSSGIYFCVLWGKDTVKMFEVIKIK